MVEIKEIRDDDPNPSDSSGLHQRRHADNEGPEQEAGEGDNEVATVDGEVVEPTFNEQVDRAREAMQPTPMEKFMALAKSLILRALVIYFVMSFIRGNSTPPKTSTAKDASGKPVPALLSNNVYANGTEFDLYVYVSEDSFGIKNFTHANLLWLEEGLIYGDWYGGPAKDGIYTHTSQVSLTERVQNNGSIYMHTYLVPAGFSPDPTAKARYSRTKTIHASKMLNRFKRKRYAKTHNLITGETTASIEEQEKAKLVSSEIVSHWHPNMTINLVTDWTAWTAGAVPPPLGDYIQFIPDELSYKPALFHNDYWNLRKDYEPINSTLSEIPLTLTFQPLSMFKWQLYAAQAARSQWNLFPTGEDDDEEQDTLKEAILETNPYLLGLTFVISVLHSIFEFLAFKNDIQFWNNRKSLEGLSVRSVLFGVFQSLVVLLYVLDNDTNFVIRMSVFVGLLIELWKINKVMDVSLDRDNKIFGIFPKPKFADKGSYIESSTREYDIMAFKYLSWAVYPLLAGYAVYSLVYVEQKGWYSWVLNMLYGFLLTFGFIMMTPQLFINYKLKSVAHLPWRMLSYKFLNTFIDDIFAFVIKMPTLYRIGTLRDDVIFFIFLYQRYIYRIDPKRVNEFGFSAEMLEEKAKAELEKAGEQQAIKATANGAKASKSSSKDKKRQ